MTNFEVTSIIAAWVGISVNLVLFVVFALQLRELRHQVKMGEHSTRLDHERRKKQATIEFYAMTLEKRAAIGHLIPDDRDDAGISRMLEANSRNDDLIRSVLDYLGVYEVLAASVNTDIFDLAVMEKVAGSRIRAMARNYWPLIAELRIARNAPALFEELRTLAAELEVRQIAT